MGAASNPVSIDDGMSLLDVLPGIANFLLCHLPEGGPDADTVVRLARAEGVFLRDAVRMGARLGPRAVRIAVKDAAANARLLAVLRTICLPGAWA